MTPIADMLCAFALDRDASLFVDESRRTRVDAVAVDGRPIPRYTNEFWTARQRGGHSLHEISYRACFKAELPRFFIEHLTLPGDRVYDPFMGRGTTLVEAALLGRHVAGNDVNPLSRILVEPRLNPPTLEQIAERLQTIPWNDRKQAEIDLSMFYSPATESRIVSLRDYLRSRRDADEEDLVDRWIRMVATNRLTGHSRGFFSVYTMPPNQAVSAEAQKKINARRRQTPPDRDVAQIILRKSKDLQQDLTEAQRRGLRKIHQQARLSCAPAQDKVALAPESVALVVTSPPFLDIVDYVTDNWLRCWFNTIDAATVAQSITMSRTVEAWSATMARALTNLRRALKPGGWIAFEVGEVRKGRVLLDEVIAPIGIEAGFHCEGIVVNQQIFTKTANCWGVTNNARGTNSNRIVLFTKR